MLILPGIGGENVVVRPLIFYFYGMKLSNLKPGDKFYLTNLEYFKDDIFQYQRFDGRFHWFTLISTNYPIQQREYRNRTVIPLPCPN